MCICFAQRECQTERERKTEEKESEMGKTATFFAMSLGAFVFWQSMDKLHVWIALHQDEKREREERERQIRKMREELIQEAKQRDSLE